MAIGIAASYCYESPKPPEFGQAGHDWEKVGWRVRVRFARPLLQIQPGTTWTGYATTLPQHYSSLRPNGGLQGVYLT
jgi:putative restriction endonuclease